MRRRSKAGVVGLWVTAGMLSGLSGAAAQQSLPGSDAAAAVSRADRTLNFSVLDSTGEPVGGVQAQQLLVFAGDRRVDNPVLSEAGGQPESVCIVIDDSGSMHEAADAVKDQVKRLVAELPPNDEVCLVAFASLVARPVDFEQSRARVTDSLPRLPKPYGGSSTIDAMISTARHLMEKAKFPSRSLILIGDGVDNSSDLNDSALRDLLRRPGAPVVYAIVNPEEEKEEKAARQRLKWMTEETGGVAYFLKKSSEAGPTADRLVRVIGGRYRLVISTDDDSLNSKTQPVRVEPDDDLRKQRVELKVAREYDASK